MNIVDVLYHISIYAESLQTRKALQWCYFSESHTEMVERIHTVNERAWVSFMTQPKPLPCIDELIDACTELMKLI